MPPLFDVKTLKLDQLNAWIINRAEGKDLDLLVARFVMGLELYGINPGIYRYSEQGNWNKSNVFVVPNATLGDVQWSPSTDHNDAFGVYYRIEKRGWYMTICNHITPSTSYEVSASHTSPERGFCIKGNTIPEAISRASLMSIIVKE